MKIEKLCITAQLGSPYAGDVTAPLDGILLSLACARAFGGVLSFAEPGQTAQVDYALAPLDVETFSGGMFYACSFAQWGQCVDGVTFWNRHADFDLYRRYTSIGNVNFTKGPSKAYHTPIAYRSSPTVRWYCRGNADDIADLLRYALHIGKKQAQGFGHVVSWRIERAREDYSLFDKDGNPTRAIPVAYIQERFGSWPVHWPLARRSYLPPYWSPDNVADVFVPPGAV